MEGSESTRVAGIAEDITEQKQGELERQRLLDLYENLPVLTASVNAQSKRVEECSKYLLERLGYDREDVVDHSLFDLYHEECLGDVEAAFGEFTSSGQVQRDRLALKAKDGSTLNVELRATAIRDDDGQIVACRSVWHETGG